MSKQKVIITDDANRINPLLSDGWFIVSITRQEVSCGGEAGGVAYGKFCFLLTKK